MTTEIIKTFIPGPPTPVTATVRKLQANYTVEFSTFDEFPQSLDIEEEVKAVLALDLNKIEEEGCSIDDVCDMVSEELSDEKNKELMKHGLSGLDDLL